jgi:diadenosine tetraphosphate (Ap4A) HIT family hydrolase
MSVAPQAVTAIHRMVERCRAGDYSAAVAKLNSGWVVMGERQVFPGYCLLLPDPLVDQLNALESAAQSQFLSDMALIGDALLAATAAVRINYAIFGNLEPALHAHVFPRYADDPQAIRTGHPWAVDWNLAAVYSDALHGELKARIARAISDRSLSGAEHVMPVHR